MAHRGQIPLFGEPKQKPLLSTAARCHRANGVRTFWGHVSACRPVTAHNARTSRRSRVSTSDFHSCPLWCIQIPDSGSRSGDSAICNTPLQHFDRWRTFHHVGLTLQWTPMFKFQLLPRTGEEGGGGKIYSTLKCFNDRALHRGPFRNVTAWKAKILLQDITWIILDGLMKSRNLLGSAGGVDVLHDVVLSFFLSFFFWPLLPPHSRCRGSLLYPITLRLTTVGRIPLD